MNLKINEGITPSQIEELIIYSTSDELIRKTTTDTKRFKNLTTTKKWLLKNRKIYTLVNNENRLMGIIWFGKKEMPNENNKYNMTFSIRLYASARGKGLAKIFIKEAIEKYKTTIEYKENSEKRFWLITNSDNLAAIKTYKYFGFKEIPYRKEKNRIIMVTDLL
jgi:ribosomal protein S18 acetylase RimI-like enzyme